MNVVDLSRVLGVMQLQWGMWTVVEVSLARRLKVHPISSLILGHDVPFCYTCDISNMPDPSESFGNKSLERHAGIGSKGLTSQTG